MKRTRTITWEDPMKGAKEAMQMDGVDYLQAMSDHKFPLPPLLYTLDFSVSLIEKGNVVFEFTPQEFHYNPIGTVHGGVITAILVFCYGLFSPFAFTCWKRIYHFRAESKFPESCYHQNREAKNRRKGDQPWWTYRLGRSAIS